MISDGRVSPCCAQISYHHLPTMWASCDPSIPPVIRTKNKATIASFLKQDTSRTVVWPLCSEGTWTAGSFQQPWGNIRMNMFKKVWLPSRGFYLLFSPRTYSASFITETKVFFFFFGESILSTMKIGGTAKVFHELNFNLLLFTLRTRLVYVTDFKWLFNRL